MLSFAIALNIDENHVAASLVRIEQKLTIERDLFYMRLFPLDMKMNPCVIISACIDCIDDLLCDFINYYRREDMIVHIACAIVDSINGEQMKSLKSDGNDQFFGLNLRLLLQSALRDLIHRRKHHHYPKYRTPPTSPRRTFSTNPPPINTTESDNSITSPTSNSVFNFPLTSIIDEIVQTSKSPRHSLKDYCGLQDDKEIISPASTPTQTTELTSSTSPVIKNDFPSQQRSMMNQLTNIPITFFNDTICLAIGEANDIYHHDYERILVVNSNTNFDFAFIDRGQLVSKPSDVLPTKISRTNNDLSTRGLMNIYKKLRQEETKLLDDHTLAERAFKGDKDAIKAYEIFARRLGKYLLPYITSFNPNLLLIGGNLAQSWYLIDDKLRRRFRKFSSMEIYFSLFNDQSICLGAVHRQLSHLSSQKTKLIRHTDQYLLPVTKIEHGEEYSSHEIPIGYIGVGHRTLNEKFVRLIEENPVLLIDGIPGTNFDEFAENFNEFYFRRRRKRKFVPLFFYDTKIFLRTEKNIEQSSNDFDLKTHFIDLKKFNYLQNNLSYPCVIIGPGASFINETSPLIYIDLPKSELNYRLPRITNSSMFHRLKQELLPRMDIFIDSQRPNCPTWINGDTFRQTLAHLSNQPIRTRPWMKNSGQFWEMLTSNTGILLSDINNHLMEFSWDIFYHSQATRILGNSTHYRLFHQYDDPPISFNLFDGEYSFEESKRNRAYYIIETNQLIAKEIKLCSTNKHDFFLVPNPTTPMITHNQMILEIFTKCNRLQLTTNNHQSKTAEFFLHTDQLRCRPVSIRVEANQYEEQQLPTPDFYIYDLHRLIISPNQSIEIVRKTENRFHLCVLVQGEAIEMIFNAIDYKQDQQIRRYHYLETFIIPASIDQYYIRPITLKDNSSSSHILLIAFLKED